MKLDFSFGCTGWKAEFSFSKKQGPCGAPGICVCVCVERGVTVHLWGDVLLPAFNPCSGGDRTRRTREYWEGLPHHAASVQHQKKMGVLATLFVYLDGRGQINRQSVQNDGFSTRLLSIRRPHIETKETCSYNRTKIHKQVNILACSCTICKLKSKKHLKYTENI